jgi:hypothetical protein
MIAQRTKSQQKRVKITESNIDSIYEKCPKMSEFMLEEKELDNNRGTKNASFQEKADFLEFQQLNNNNFSRFPHEEIIKKEPRGPEYRVINKYVKSKKQYWKERSRRKKAWELSNKLTYKQIAEKLGVSEKTVQRDIRKIQPYYRRLSQKYFRELQQERIMKLETELEGKNLHQRFKILTRKWIEYQNLLKVRKYVRHLIKVVIDMNDLTEGCPKITFWPQHWSGELPIHLRFIVKHDGEKEVLGSMTLNRSH